MSGKSRNLLSFVGATKVARQPRILASTRLNGKTHPHMKPQKSPARWQNIQRAGD